MLIRETGAPERRSLSLTFPTLELNNHPLHLYCIVLSLSLYTALFYGTARQRLTPEYPPDTEAVGFGHATYVAYRDQNAAFYPPMLKSIIRTLQFIEVLTTMCRIQTIELQGTTGSSRPMESRKGDLKRKHFHTSN